MRGFALGDEGHLDNSFASLSMEGETETIHVVAYETELINSRQPSDPRQSFEGKTFVDLNTWSLHLTPSLSGLAMLCYIPTEVAQQ